MVEQAKPAPEFRSIESDEEIMENKEEIEDESVSTLSFTGTLPDKFELIICNGKLSKTMAQVVMAPTWTLVGTGETTKGEEDKKKTKTGLEFYTFDKRVVCIKTDDYSGSSVNEMTH